MIGRNTSGEPSGPGAQARPGAHRGSAMSANSAPAASSFSRFLWIFTIFGIIVIAVVIGFLIGIVRALESIDNGLFTSSTLVTGATGNVTPLPDYIHTINSALTDIDTALKPIRGQVADATASLVSIRGTAHGIDTSLIDTSQSLTSTSGSLTTISTTLTGAAGSAGAISGSLIDTSSALLNIHGITQSIDGTLETIQNADSRGTALITPQVNDINHSLIGAEQDLTNINLQLQETNHHLTNICTSPTLSLLPPFKCHP
jgi:methyl-accepting chemotaxis protein